MATFFTTAPTKWKVPEYKDKLGRDTRRQYPHHVNQAWYSVFLPYDGQPGSENFDLPENARASRKRLFAKLDRYRKRGMRKIT